MSKSSRDRYFARLHGTMKAAPIAPTASPAPMLKQTVTVERNPFTPDQIEPRPDARITSTANLTKEYVPSRTTGYYPFIQALPPYIDDLTQQFGAQVYDQMVTDPVVWSSYRVFVMSILSGGYDIVPSLTRDDHDYDTAVWMRDFVEKNISNLKTSYSICLEQQLAALVHGSSVAEQVYQTEHYAHGDHLHLKDLRDKPLINTVFVVDSFYNTVGILTQRFPGQNYPAGSYIPIDFSMIGNTPEENPVDLTKIIPGFLPRYLFSVLTNGMQYNDERGRSMLRPAYQPWWIKQQLIAEHLSHLSKFASPSIWAETAPGAQPQTLLQSDGTPLLDSLGNPVTQTPEQVLSDALAGFQNGSAIAVPNGSKATVIPAGGDGQAFIQALNYYDRQIVYAVTSQALATQEGMHQSRASSDTHQDILEIGIGKMKTWLCDQQRREVFAPLLRYNFDETGEKIARYIPKLRLGYGSGFPPAMKDIASLMSANYFGQSPDSTQIEKLDAMLGLPIREKATAGAGGMGGVAGSMQQPQQPLPFGDEDGGDTGDDNTDNESENEQ